MYQLTKLTYQQTYTIERNQKCPHTFISSSSLVDDDDLCGGWRWWWRRAVRLGVHDALLPIRFVDTVRTEVGGTLPLQALGSAHWYTEPWMVSVLG